MLIAGPWCGFDRYFTRSDLTKSNRLVTVSFYTSNGKTTWRWASELGFGQDGVGACYNSFFTFEDNFGKKLNATDAADKWLIKMGYRLVDSRTVTMM